MYVQMQLKPPVLLLHGWPGSIVEFQTLQGLLQADGHPLVIPCIPGYGYSTAPQREGYDVFETATTYHKLMDRLGYERFLIQVGVNVVPGEIYLWGGCSFAFHSHDVIIL